MATVWSRFDRDDDGHSDGDHNGEAHNDDGHNVDVILSLLPAPPLLSGRCRVGRLVRMITIVFV